MKAGLRPAPDLHLTRHSDRYGLLEITAWRHMHQELDRSGPFKDWPKDQDLPIVEGTVVRTAAEHLPGGRQADKDMWLWIAGPLEPDADLIDLAWKACLRRFDQEHFHRFSKVYPGLDRAHLASAEAAGRWVALAVQEPPQNPPTKPPPNQMPAQDAWRQAVAILHDLHHPDAALVHAKLSKPPPR